MAIFLCELSKQGSWLSFPSTTTSKGKGWVSHQWQAARGWAISFTPSPRHSSGPALQCATASQGQGKLSHAYTVWNSSPALPSQRVGSPFALDAACERQSQLSASLGHQHGSRQQLGVHDVHMAFGYHRHQHKHLLPQGHGPSHGPQQQHRPGYHHGLTWQHRRLTSDCFLPSSCLQFRLSSLCTHCPTSPCLPSLHHLLVYLSGTRASECLPPCPRHVAASGHPLMLCPLIKRA